MFYDPNGVYDWAGGTKWKDNNPNAHLLQVRNVAGPGRGARGDDLHHRCARAGRLFHNHLDYPCTRFASCNNYSVGKGRERRRPRRGGVHNERLTLLWIDGHVTTVRWEAPSPTSGRSRPTPWWIPRALSPRLPQA